MLCNINNSPAWQPQGCPTEIFRPNRHLTPGPVHNITTSCKTCVEGAVLWKNRHHASGSAELTNNASRTRRTTARLEGPSNDQAPCPMEESKCRCNLSEGDGRDVIVDAIMLLLRTPVCGIQVSAMVHHYWRHVSPPFAQSLTAILLSTPGQRGRSVREHAWRARKILR